MALPRENRLPLRFERDRISREGKTFYTQNITLVVAPPVILSEHSESKNLTPPTTPTPHSKVPRFGILLSKKVAKQAVDRNLIRRRVSAAIAGLLTSFPVADYLVIPKRSVLEIPHTELISDLKTLTTRVK